jgi:hypothetical protein
MSFLSENDDDPYNPRKNLTVGLILAMVVGGTVVMSRYWDSIFGSSDARRASRLDRELRSGVQMVNSMAPRRVDEVTTLTGARAQGNEFTYLYSLSQEIPAERLAAAPAEIERVIRPRFCSDREMQRIIQLGAIISAEYRDTRHHMIKVTIRDCAPQF